MHRRWRIPGVVCALLIVATAAAAHDLFLKPDRFFVEAYTDARIALFNGTFTSSESAVTWDRVVEAHLTTPDGVVPVDRTIWHVHGDTTHLSVRTGSSGTYVLGVSTHPRVLRLEAEDFNNYLASEGIPDALNERRRRGELDRPARERYSKHVKTLLQVGPERTAQYGTVLGHPAELVPLTNPYTLKSGDTLRVRALLNGRPVANQVVLAGGRGPGSRAITESETRTDADGIASVVLRSAGQWYVKFIRMERLAQDTTADYESNWTTLTFEIR